MKIGTKNYVDCKIREIITEIEKLTLTKIQTNIENEFKVLVFKGSGFIITYDYRKEEIESTTFNKDTNEYIIGLLNKDKIKEKINDLHIYIQWKVLKQRYQTLK